MLGERLEVRLDAARRQRLNIIATARKQPIAAVIRDLIDQEHEALLAAKRRQAAEALGRLEVEDVPDPDILSRQLDETYAVDLR